VHHHLEVERVARLRVSSSRVVADHAVVHIGARTTVCRELGMARVALGIADDVARGLPTAVTLAAKDEAFASELVQALGSSTFRPYHTTDVRGVEIGGAAKNVLAIAAGIVVGKNLGASAQAALTTRGFSELARFGRALGARAETMVGLSGLGDLILTCSSPQSRNFALGLALGRGEPACRQLAAREVQVPGVAVAHLDLDEAGADHHHMPCRMNALPQRFALVEDAQVTDIGEIGVGQIK